MEFTGKWKFHSIAVWDENGNTSYLNAEEYLNSPMPYIDEADEEAVKDELDERKKTVGMQVKINKDGNLYILMPVPEGASKKELKAFLEESGMLLVDGMLCDKPIKWELRDGELWFNPGFAESEEDGMIRAIDKDGYFVFFTTRFEKAE